MQRPIPVLGTLVGAIVTTLVVVMIDAPQTRALTMDQYDNLRGAAPTAEQQATQEDVADRTRELIERFTQQRMDETGPPESVEEVTEEVTEEELFDPGPVESFTESQGLQKPVDDLPNSGLGFPIVGLALSITALKYRKKFRKVVSPT